MVEGNIYTHNDIAQIAGQHPAVQGNQIEHYQIQSHKVKEVHIDADTG
jgi:hypothetical protein